jgi:hypothetical protein
LKHLKIKLKTFGLSELEVAWTLWEKIKHCEMTQNNLYEPCKCKIHLYIPAVPVVVTTLGGLGEI